MNGNGNDVPKTSIGQQLLAIRQAADLSQEAMARAVGVSLTMYRKYESDEVAPLQQLIRKRVEEIIADPSLVEA